VNNLAIKITKAMVASDYGLSAIGTRGVYFDEALRTAVFERDKYTCQKCGLKHCVLNAHHKKTYKKHPELRFDVPNGETLCFDCHQQKHRRRI